MAESLSAVTALARVPVIDDHLHRHLASPNASGALLLVGSYRQSPVTAFAVLAAVVESDRAMIQRQKELEAELKRVQDYYAQEHAREEAAAADKARREKCLRLGKKFIVTLRWLNADCYKLGACIGQVNLRLSFGDGATV